MLHDRFCMKREENIFLAKRNLVDSIYKESRLEGIKITFPETIEIYEGRNVGRLSIEDVVKVNNLKHAWNFVLETVDYPLDLRYLRQLDQEIGAGLVPRSGELRTSDVNIGGTSWKPEIPVYEKAEEKVQEIMQMDLSATERAITMMLELMRSQLFYDGNKRVAQLAANQIMIQNGVGIISIPVEFQAEFFERLVTYYETNESKELKQFLYDTSIEGIDFTKVEEQEPVTKEDFYQMQYKGSVR